MAKKQIKKLREKLIDSIMKNKYGDDDPKYYDENLVYLKSLSTEKLEDLCEEVFHDDDID